MASNPRTPHVHSSVSHQRFRAQSKKTLSFLISAALLAIAVPATAAGDPQAATKAAEAVRPATTAQVETRAKVDFATSLVPKIPASLPVLKLAPHAPPEEFMAETLGKLGVKKGAIQPLRKTHSAVTNAKLPEEWIGVIEKDKVRAFWDRRTGDTGLFPVLERLKTEKFAGLATENPHLARASELARDIFARQDILPKDATQYSIGKAEPLVGTKAQKGADGKVKVSDTLQYLTYVPVARTVDGYPVRGPGSRALLAVDNGGAIQGFLLRWNVASPNGTAREARDARKVYDALKSAVAPMATFGSVKVDSVRIVYYDDGANQMVPAYELTVRVEAPLTEKTSINDGFTVVYAPFGNATLPASLTSAPIPDMQNQENAEREGADKKVPAGDPTYGYYVDRNAESGFLGDAHLFRDAIKTMDIGGSFTLKQHVWSYPYEFESKAASYVDSVQIALAEGHGSWWGIATNKHDDSVDFDKLTAAQGYGSVNKGKLCYLILHGCNTVPSAEDAPCPAGSPQSDTRTWSDTWFRVFQGMHAVVGFRSEGNWGDQIGTQFGTWIAIGTPFISAWMTSAMTDPIYQLGNMHKNPCGLLIASGRPSAVAVCGHGDDTVFDTSKISAPSCLVNYWQPH